MNQNKKPIAAPSLRQLGRLRRQTGELSMIEAAAVMAGAALLALAAYAGGKFVYDRVQAYRFKEEAQFFHSGVLDATVNDTDFSGETLQNLALNKAFDSAGSRVASDHSTVQGLFGGAVTAGIGSVDTTNDAVIVNYPVPASVCTLSMAAIVNAYTMVAVNGTTIFGPSTTFDSATVGAACQGNGPVTVSMYTTKN
jgi:hypothetical protein